MLPKQNSSPKNWAGVSGESGWWRWVGYESLDVLAPMFPCRWNQPDRTGEAGMIGPKGCGQDFWATPRRHGMAKGLLEALMVKSPAQRRVKC